MLTDITESADTTLTFNKLVSFEMSTSSVAQVPTGKIWKLKTVSTNAAGSSLKINGTPSINVTSAGTAVVYLEDLTLSAGTVLGATVNTLFIVAEEYTI